jgi:hypothetical protein
VVLDLIFVTVSVAFFAVCLGYIGVCERLSQKTQK